MENSGEICSLFHCELFEEFIDITKNFLVLLRTFKGRILLLQEKKKRGELFNFFGNLHAQIYMAFE